MELALRGEGGHLTRIPYTTASDFGSRQVLSGSHISYHQFAASEFFNCRPFTIRFEPELLCNLLICLARMISDEGKDYTGVLRHCLIEERVFSHSETGYLK